MSSILVIGGAGYIGSHCVNQLVQQPNTEVVVFDNFSTGHKELLAEKATLVEGDIRDEALLTRTLRDYNIDAVMHFAAFASVGESVQFPERYYDNNVMGSLSLLKAMVAADVKTLIFSSTCAVYGAPQFLPLTEEHPTNPVNPYGASKLMMERMMADFEQAHGLRYMALRYFNAAGASDSARIGEWHVPETHLIPLVLQAAIGERDNIKIFGTDYDTPDGTCIRDYVHVDDIADAHLKAMAYLQNGGKSDFINLGSESGYSVREVIETCKKVTDRDFDVIETERRPGDPARLVANAEKARQVLGWQVQHDNLEKVIASAWTWEQLLHNELKPRSNPLASASI